MNEIQKIKSQYSCLKVLSEKGLVPSNSTKKKITICCPFHKDRTPSFCIDTERDKWICFAGCGRGDVIDLMAKFQGQDSSQWLKSQGLISNATTPRRDSDVKTASPQQKYEIDCVYPYLNANSELLYEAVRLKPKSFRQRHKGENGEWIWNMEGVERVLYRLPQVLKSETVWIVEGEKDVESLETLGITATCNVGGAGKWLDSYSGYLKDKQIVICGDNDEPGIVHVEKVKKSVSAVAKNVRVVEIPRPHKDVSDFISTFEESSEAMLALNSLLGKSQVLYQGEPLALMAMEELESEFTRFLNTSKERALNLGAWLPSFNGYYMLPGEMLVVMAETGIGKSAICTNIQLANSGLPTVCFNMELSDHQMFKRTVQTAARVSVHAVEFGYRSGNPVDWRSTNKLSKIVFCNDSRVTMEKMISLIKRSELKLGVPPAVVIVDYMQLVQSEKRMSRYERFSDVAEELKRIAKDLNVVVIVSSQCNRNSEREYGDMSLNDAKETGSIENSCGLLLGASRNPDRKSEMCIQVLKSTDHGAGMKIYCTMDFETMAITQN